MAESISDERARSPRAGLVIPRVPFVVDFMPPCIDVLSPKNHVLDGRAVDGVLRACGLVPGDLAPASVPIDRGDGTSITVRRQASLTEDEPLPGDGRWVVQVSRWDELKDPCGVIEGFATTSAGHDAHSVASNQQFFVCWYDEYCNT